ncbi:MAG: peptide/nickel transport system ATP-binding protein ddpF [Rhodospirillaceae bacterium]|jgi:peptide/nickel transport system ATP-binding protein|nr:peptide/nickel transport system ATP-binding protein ddpF [Rhodospirillaceae bacterium]MEA2844813.1 peptide/nickel transport system ATP-binding protein ddpF [Rhodospirillaceae bacterium]
MADKKPVLEVRNLSVALPAGADRVHAVEKVSFTVNPGEIVCLVGESGSGKSVIAFTVMGLLAKALKPTSGEILLEGENILAADESRLRELRCTRMSMIFQEPMTALNPVMTCGQQVDEVLETHTKLDAAQRKAKIIAILTRVKLPEPERIYASYPHQLSGGQRQRIMIAMALVLDPVLLIADEPTTALDVTTQAEILKLIAELQEGQGTGVLFITHDFGVVAEIAHRVAVLRWGQLVEMGSTEQILSRPEHSYTKMLISSVPSIHPVHRGVRKDGITVLRTDKLGKTYSGNAFFQKARVVKAAVDVDLDIRRGETLGIVGESGSGKSTVARCIARLIDPTDGKIFLGDTEIATMSAGKLRPHRRRVQIVFQDPYRSMNPRITIGESIIEGPMNFGLKRDEALVRARKLMETVRLDPNSLDRYPHQFSGGQRQRICIARALAMEPELLIADEAVSALDVSVQKQVLELLDEIRQRLNLAVLFITHDLRVAAQICDYVAVMSKGRVVEYGSAEQVFGAPRDDYTKALFAAAPGRNWEFGKFIAA